MCARQLQQFCYVLFMNLFISFIVLMIISQQTHCAQLTDGEKKNFSADHNASVSSIAGTILVANQRPAPTCVMKVLTSTGQETQSGGLRENLILQVDVQPSNVYGGFVRSCRAESPAPEDDFYFEMTDAHGCETEPHYFGKWEYNQSTRLVTAKFRPFKFPNSDDITFKCKVTACLGQCQPVNCGGEDAFRRRRKRQISDEIDCSTAFRVSYKTKTN